MATKEMTWEEERAERLKVFDKAVEDFAWNHLNKMSRSEMDDVADVIANRFIRTHRTLQQSMISLIYTVFKKLIQNKYHQMFDLRNEQSAKFIKDCVDKDYYFPFV